MTPEMRQKQIERIQARNIQEHKTESENPLPNSDKLAYAYVVIAQNQEK